MNVYKARELGREYCMTEGSEHYYRDGVEQMDILISLDLAETFCLGNINKYFTRYCHNGDLEDVRKLVDYAHILCGLVLDGTDDVASGIRYKEGTE